MKILLTTIFYIITLNLYAQVEISGTVKNYSDSVFYIGEAGGFNNLTRVWRDRRVKVAITKDKTFNIVIPEEFIGSWVIKAKTGNEIFDLVHGEKLQLVVDFAKPDPAYAVGKNAGDFNFLNVISDSAYNYSHNAAFYQKLKSKNIDTALIYRKQYASYELALLNKYRAKYEMSDNYYHWLQSKFAYEPYERTFVENVTSRDSLSNNELSKLMEKGVDDNYAALNTVEYNDLAEFYINSIFNKRSNKLTLADRFNYVADGNILSGNTKDVYLTRLMASLASKPDSIYAPLFKKYDQIVSNKQMKQLVIARRNDYINPTNGSAANSRIISLNSISDILSKYKGKVVYLDFWASWCLPCRAEMPNAENLKEKLKGKNIVFVYLGYKDKINAWLKARNEIGIEGEHYLLTDKMANEADKIFEIKGIPHYAIIGKDGKIVDNNAGRPNDAYKKLIRLVD